MKKCKNLTISPEMLETIKSQGVALLTLILLVFEINNREIIRNNAALVSFGGFKFEAQRLVIL